ncbi:ATPase AAA domain-containing protein 1, variant 2 [Orbilia oligospora]|nr:ATPase AAA domain-containing protein 1, variant 2 [Orbilia oligospora]KAF3082357.1 ATPase AAA domain-containing protein 1, variant 2 [Orbilia oligospora]KAF3093807.1 ATPase AAA domain-containing protein 1, variant 2 [Orbilia oligospora]KAF3138134.1 ATPase AAA domain-containing protein 1, variant 2 [Orbilia oligospora]KAF3148885.1 ATPase AAA domain-containing protein 1, variant 2 [Orbilia oligospora]
MLAKALAHESGACFINLHISTLTEKWYGDSNKLVAALFSLARKLEPSIIFIDEIDAVLRSRSSSDHEASTMVKAEFMTHWDGLLSTVDQRPPRIVVLGATNRIQDIDEAILRRLPKRFAVSLPNAEQRKRILKIILKDTKLDVPEGFSLDDLVKRTAGMSGSDMKEACRDAAMIPIREYIKEKKASGEENLLCVKPEEVRGVRNEDFFRRRQGSSYSSTQDRLIES